MTVAPKQRSFTASRSIEKQEPDVVGRWRGRPVLAMLVRFAAVLFPIIIATVAAFGVSRLFPPATTLGAVLAQWVAVIAVATLTVRITRPVAKRFLPLGALLELTLVFPDEAPSRIQTAMKHTSEEELRELIAHTRKHGLPSDSSKAAGIILTLVAELNRHDRLTRGHAERVRVYTGLIAEEMGLSRDEVGRLQWAGLLHDIGKLAVSGDILNKPGELTDDEYDEF